MPSSSVLPLLLTVSLAIFPSLSLSATHYHEWNVTWASVAPNCVTKTVATINGQFPGPPIHATTGDRMIVKVCSYVDAPVSIHWHGLHFQGQQWYDGPAFGSQCPIVKDSCFTYNFTVLDQHGSYWYHGHINLLRSSIYGAFIIYPKKGVAVPFPKPDGELHFLLNEWFNKYEEDLKYSLYTTGALGAPDSLLVNGRGITDCETYTCAYGEGNPKCGKCLQESSGCFPLSTFVVKPNKTYRLRILNVGLLRDVNFVIEGHSLTIVMADGNFLEPTVADRLELNPGQSYDVLFNTNEEPGNYWIAINGEKMGGKYFEQPGLAVLKYEKNPNFDKKVPSGMWPQALEDEISFGNQQQLGYKNYQTVLGLKTKKVDRYFSLQWTQVLIEGQKRFVVNGRSYVDSKTPLLAAEYYGIKDQFGFQLPDHFPHIDPTVKNVSKSAYGTSYITAKKGEFVQIVFQSHTPPGDVHPFHLHGHDFYIVGYGSGTYDKDNEAVYEREIYNLVNPPRRNQVTIYENQWAAVRFTAVTGAWNMHCHAEPHMMLGMQLYFRVLGDVGDIPSPPLDYPKCGALENYLKSSI